MLTAHHVRPPAVAGQFYPGNAGQLTEMVHGFLDQAAPKVQEPTILAMVPHAGYLYSGTVAGKTLGQANLPSTLVLLGPNHTGMGAPLAIWDRGEWEMPGGPFRVAEELAAALMEAEPRLTPDTAAHLREHSLEVELPFLKAQDSSVSGVPIAVADPRLEVLLQVGRSLGKVLKEWPEAVGLVVSSDMSHYIPHSQAEARDRMALEHVLDLDPAGLYNVVRDEGISMCGVLPMTLGLAAAIEMGASRAETIAYATSGDVSGDMEQVVGYAGVLVS